MRLQYFLISSLLLLLVEQIHAIPRIPYESDSSPLANWRNNESEMQRVVREKRSPLGKLALLGGAAVVGRKHFCSAVLLLELKLWLGRESSELVCTRLNSECAGPLQKGQTFHSSDFTLLLSFIIFIIQILHTYRYARTWVHTLIPAIGHVSATAPVTEVDTQVIIITGTYAFVSMGH